MDRTRLHPVRGRVLTWVLSALVIAGVLAMHVMGGHDAVDPQSMDMNMTAPAPGTSATDVSPMDMPGRAAMSGMTAVSATSATSGTRAVPGRTPAPIALAVAAGHGMSDMSCCVLFLITTAALVLLSRIATARYGATPPGAGGGFGALTRRRGPPSTAPPRFSLCVLRV